MDLSRFRPEDDWVESALYYYACKYEYLMLLNPVVAIWSRVIVETTPQIFKTGVHRIGKSDKGEEVYIIDGSINHVTPNPCIRCGNVSVFKRTYENAPGLWCVSCNGWTMS